MQYTSHYTSPLGEILLAADMTGLTGLWFEGQKYFARCLDKEHEEREIPLFVQTKRWLDIYFSGREPDFSIPLHLTGTDFQRKVWKILCGIPYGQTVTYGQIAEQIALQTAEQTPLHPEGISAGKPAREIAGQFLPDRGRQRMSAQAVGGAVGRNEISIIVPCHRVVGAKGKLTGYAGGLDKKEKLLTLEKADIQKGRML